MFLENFLIFIISPVYIFIIQLINIPFLYYFSTSYTVSIILFTFILMKGSLKDSLLNYSGLIFFTLLCLIEYLNYYQSGVSLNGLSDIRMILYNPLHSKILTFTLYITYILISSKKIRLYHFYTSFKMYLAFGHFFILIWMLTYFNIVNFPTSILDSNRISYVSLFLLFCLLFFKKELLLNNKYYYWSIFINTSIIFLNTTRGATLILMVLILFLTLKKAFNSISKPLTILSFLIFIPIIIFILIKIDLSNKILGNDFNQLASRFIDVSLIDLEHENHLMELDASNNRFRNNSQYAFSSVSRLFANYYSILAFLKEPFFGAGSGIAYSIQVLGNGVHSFIFLFLTSTGIVGILLISFLIKILSDLLGPINNKYIMSFLVFSILQFENSFPIYFSLLFLSLIHI